MGKKTPKKKAAKQEKSRNLSVKPVTEDDATDPNENRFDFGGLPKRDLKKNLGCG